MHLDRRTVLSTVASSLFAARLTGREYSQDFQQELGEAIQQFMAARNIPGGAFAIVDKDRLLFQQPIGFADRDSKEPVTTKSLFRIASLSKPITAMGILKLVEQSKLKLDDLFLDLVQTEQSDALNSIIDPRIHKVSIRHLLHHTAGWDRNATFDPMFATRSIAKELGVRSPATIENIIEFMLKRSLDFEPGSRYCYSNFGYCLLGRVIASVAKEPYASFIQREILAPCGAKSMRLAKTRLEDRNGNEVRYYDSDDTLTVSVFDNDLSKVEWPYGGFSIEAMDAHGGWLASIEDIANLAIALQDASACPIFSESTYSMMFEPPPAPMPQNPTNYYGLGWDVRRHEGIATLTFDHDGSLPGTYCCFFHRWDGITWLALFNKRSGIEQLPDQDLERIVNTTIDRNKS